MHEPWMRLAIEEAKKGLGLTSPNPTVGSVIVKDGKVLGKGFHPKAGMPHAERMALADAHSNHPPDVIAGATIYVTLEPCSTTGKTPPCTQGILDAKIAHVVYGSTDPNPAHQGAAKQLLESHGLTVTSGILEQECNALIRDFSKRVLTGLPWVVAKTAMSLDGKITRPPGESQWLTSPESRAIVHEIRALSDAIIIGGRTLRKDNPRLTLRGNSTPVNKQQPYRAVITHASRSELPEDLHVFTDEHKDRTIIYQDTEFLDILKALAAKGCNNVMLECGGGLMGQWFDLGLVDECYFFLAPMINGGSDLAVAGKGANSNASAIRLKDVNHRQIGNDVLAHGLVVKGA